MMHSVMLYAAPVWSERFAMYENQQQPLKRIQRGMALRVICGYKTVSHVAASILGRVPPLHLLAARQKRLFERIKDLKSWGEYTPEARRELEVMADIILERQWKIYFANPSLPSKRVREAILPVFSEWVKRKHGELTYHMTQLITGHGSFGEFLHWIRKVRTPICPHCGVANDTVEHMLEVCSSWERQREELRAIVGEDLRWKTLIPRILRNPEWWKAVAAFASEVMSAKEAAENTRQDEEDRIILIGGE